MNKNDLEALAFKPVVRNGQNLSNIEHISATRTGSVWSVLKTMKKCEVLEITPDQTDMMTDIIRSVNEHFAQSSVVCYYLVRYGMLLEMERSKEERNHEES